MIISENKIITEQAHCDLRLDKALTLLFPEHSRTFFEELIDEGSVLINDKIVKKRVTLSLGDTVLVKFPQKSQAHLEKQNIPLNILFEDEHLVIINKPAGLVVHPACGHPDGTLVNGLLYHCNLEEGLDESNLRPGIVHRLDKDTSGVLIACKTKKAHEALTAMFQNRQIKKTYLAICLGKVMDERIDAPIKRHKTDRQKMCVSFEENAKNATTIVKNLISDHEVSLVKLDLITGRTHQIRVHMRYKNTPVLGDPVYGFTGANKTFEAHRQYLHAYQVEFIHPITNELLSIKAKIPEDMEVFLSKRHIALDSLV
jgi:23S rRNA pseudouridine1911/1915/1917 synthase